MSNLYSLASLAYKCCTISLLNIAQRYNFTQAGNSIFYKQQYLDLLSQQKNKFTMDDLFYSFTISLLSLLCCINCFADGKHETACTSYLTWIKHAQNAFIYFANFLVTCLFNLTKYSSKCHYFEGMLFCKKCHYNVAGQLCWEKQLESKSG